MLGYSQSEWVWGVLKVVKLMEVNVCSTPLINTADMHGATEHNDTNDDEPRTSLFLKHLQLRFSGSRRSS